MNVVFLILLRTRESQPSTSGNVCTSSPVNAAGDHDERDRQSLAGACWQLSLQSTVSVSFQARIDECHRAVTKFVVKGLDPFATADAPDFRITISHVTLGHISKMVSPSGKISSAPRMFSVFGKRALGNSGVHLGTFLYDENGDPLQTFRIPDHKVDVIRYVTLHVLNNLGNHKYSCLYSFGVHGKLT